MEGAAEREGGSDVVRLGHIGVARPEEREIVRDFVLLEYRSSEELSVLSAADMPGDEAPDGLSSVLCAWTKGGDLISTMRMTVCPDRALAEATMDCGVPGALGRFPVAVVSRVATAGAYRSRRLNSALRYHGLRWAREVGLRHSMGVVGLHARRMRLLRDIGYDLYPLHQDRGQWLRFSGPKVVAALDLRRMPDAIRILGERCGKVLGQFPWRGAWIAPVRSSRGGAERIRETVPSENRPGANPP